MDPKTITIYRHFYNGFIWLFQLLFSLLFFCILNVLCKFAAFVTLWLEVTWKPKQSTIFIFIFSFIIFYTYFFSYSNSIFAFGPYLWSEVNAIHNELLAAAAATDSINNKCNSIKHLIVFSTKFKTVRKFQWNVVKQDFNAITKNINK